MTTRKPIGIWTPIVDGQQQPPEVVYEGNNLTLLGLAQVLNPALRLVRTPVGYEWRLNGPLPCSFADRG